MYPVITISREFGSGGHSIGEKVAKKLNIPFLDQEIVNQVAEESGYAREMVEEQGEHASAANKWFDVSAASAMYFQSPQDEIFIIQKKVILEAAAKGPCVIVGRCADYILRGKADCLRVFIGADMDYRKAYVQSHYEDTGVPVEKRLKERDSHRQSYVQHYTGAVWGERENYNLCLDSGKLGEDACVDIIVRAAQK